MTDVWPPHCSRMGIMVAVHFLGSPVLVWAGIIRLTRLVQGVNSRLGATRVIRAHVLRPQDRAGKSAKDGVSWRQ